jgi:hypothetical protein
MVRDFLQVATLGLDTLGFTTKWLSSGTDPMIYTRGIYIRPRPVYYLIKYRHQGIFNTVL